MCLLAPSVESAPAYRQRVLANGLLNPRGITLDGNRLLVSEAGAGGLRKNDGSNCITSGAGAEICSGFTGAIGAWDRTTQTYTQLVKGLPSLARANGSEGTGIADLLPGGPTGLLGVFGLGGNPGQPNVATLGSNLFGQVVSIELGTGTIQARSNLAAYELANDPDGQGPSSNPYALAALAGRLFATDAGGNTLLTLDSTPAPGDGSFAILSNFVFPTLSVTPPPFPPGLPNPFPANPVPTGLAVNPLTNRLLIAELAGFPFVPGSANIFSSNGLTSPSQALSGFTSITDIATGPDGSLYVLEYASDFFNPVANGSIWRVDSGGTRERLIDGLTQPTGLAVADDGTLYVTNNADSLQGELREYRPEVPGPLPLLGAAVAWGQARRLRRRLSRS
ncbi:MAG: ScyD/ScyE family protein [Synechococcaceae cyanobacterium]|nr:ScyD/ScyE family protein [Synechococcaceae cyanobacterium]